MPTTKVTVTIDAELLREVDLWVVEGEFPNRSKAFQAALVRLREELRGHDSLLRELAKLDPMEERALADEGLAGEVSWQTY